MKIRETFKNKKYVVIAVLILLIGGYYWYSKNGSGNSETEYVTEAATKGMLTTSISASGNVIVDSSANIDPTITGTVSNLAVSVGDKVKKGQLLFNIDNYDLTVNVAKAKASLTQAQSSLKTAQANKKQAQSNYNERNDDSSSYTVLEEKALKDKLEAAKISEEAALQSLAQAQADYKSNLDDAAKRNVTAPIDGTVNEINIKNGDDLSKLSSGSSRTVPMIIGDLSTMKAEVEVNEVDISNVQIGQKVMMTFTAIDGLEASGAVEKIDSLGTLESGVVTYNVTISFDSLDPKIKPEMSVSANIITEVKQNIITVPNSAVKTENGNSYVEVLNSGKAPVKVDVKVGASNNTDTEISSGVNVGDKVVTQTITSETTSSSTNANSKNNVRVPGIGKFGG